MNKYTIHDYGLSLFEINKLDEWLKNKEFIKPIVIIGNNGSGKSTLANLLLKEYTTLTLSSIDKNINETIHSLFTKRDISMMYNKSKKYKGVILDNITTKITTTHNNPIIYIYDSSLYKSVKHIQSYITIELFTKNKEIDTFIYDPIKLTETLHYLSLQDFFKLLVNDYHTIMFNILDYIWDKIDSTRLQKIYHSCLLCDNLDYYDSKLSILYGIVIPIYYCKSLRFTNIRYNSYLSHSIIYTQMNSIYNDNYEKYLLYIINKQFDKNLNKKITKFYIKLYELVYLEKFDFSILNK